MKICFRCKNSKPISEFTRNKAHKDGLASNCKCCMRETHQKNYCKNKIKSHQSVNEWRKANPDRIRAIKRKYYDNNKEKVVDYKLRKAFGISIEEYNCLVQKQNGVCAICGKPETAKYKGKPKALAVDHDHKTGEIRGLLCMRCNVEAGIIENKGRLTMILSYLENHC